MEPARPVQRYMTCTMYVHVHAGMHYGISQKIAHIHIMGIFKKLPNTYANAVLQMQSRDAVLHFQIDNAVLHLSNTLTNMHLQFELSDLLLQI